jgi:pimeloyl-ACP methyl ester carboxylesterase
MMDDFETAEIKRTTHLRTLVRVRAAGVLLLHGFPQTHLMWRRVAPLLARNFTIVCADLRGYGAHARGTVRQMTSPECASATLASCALLKNLDDALRKSFMAAAVSAPRTTIQVRSPTFTSRTILPASSTMQMLVSLTETSSPAKWSMLRFSF